MNIIVIGGGAAGLMAAGTAAEQGAQVTLLETNEKVGRKLFITGKGRCNVCNNCDVQEVLRNVLSVFRARRIRSGGRDGLFREPWRCPQD